MTLLLRLVDVLAEMVSVEGLDLFSVGIHTVLDGLTPFREELDGVSKGIIGSEVDGMGGRFSIEDLKGIDAVSLEIVRDSSDVFELAFCIHEFLGGADGLIRIDGAINFFNIKN
mgnify:CR=1 FL=1